LLGQAFEHGTIYQLATTLIKLDHNTPIITVHSS